jgi:ADP-ribosylglycohydrolase
MITLALSERIQGALLGAALGAELGWAAAARPRPKLCAPADLLAWDLSPAESALIPYRTNALKITPFVDLGVRAYLTAGGRATPEVLGALLKDDPAIAQPVFSWDGIHSTQEVLKEGMHPRLSGLGATPSGLICAAMPAVGLFHAGDPDYAYLDGVELASVAQGRMGADWAGLGAAMIAGCCAGEAAAAIDAVLKIAHQHCPEIFYQIDPYVRHAHGAAGSSEEDFVAWWLAEARPPYNKAGCWPEWNPPLFVLPLLERFGDDPRKLIPLALAATGSGPGVRGVLAAAAAGALGGPEAFPEEWRAWGEETARPWLPLGDLVEQRLHQEAQIIATTRRLATEKVGEDSLLFSKAYGCILAGAIGNAMGSPVEGRHWYEVDEQYPGGITTILNPERLEGEDDNQMAMLLLETYLEREGKPVMARHFGKTWYDRLNRDHFFPHCMGHAYDLIRAGWDARITGHWIQVTGSTVMCMEPVGAYHLADPEWASIDAAAVSYMYQRGLDVTAAATLVAAVAEAFRPEATVQSVCEAALAAAPDEPFRTFDRRAFASPRAYLQTCLEVADKYTDVMAAREELNDKCLFYHMIDPVELLGLALAMFKIADGDVRQAAIGGTNIGRDSDTIAGRAAMLAGTLRGAATIPPEWVAMFGEAPLAKIKLRAHQWADLLAGKKLERLEKRQELL